VRLVGFTMEIYYGARSYERQIMSFSWLCFRNWCTNRV